MRRLVAPVVGAALLLGAVMPAPAARANGTGTVYATSARGTVIEYDPNNKEVVNEIAGVGAGALAFSADALTIYVTNPAADGVVVFDVTDLRPLKTIPVAGGPQAIATDPVGRAVYVGTRSGAVVALDGEIQEVSVRTELSAPVIALVLSADRSQLATLTGDGVLSYLALPALTLGRQTRLEGSPTALVAQRRALGNLREGVTLSTRYWVGTSEGVLSAYEQDGVRSARMEVAGAIHDLAIDGTQSTLLIAGDAGVLYTVSAQRAEPLGTLHLKEPVTVVAVDPDGVRAYAALPSVGQMVTVSLTDMRLLDVLKGQDAPEHLAVSPLRLPGSKAALTLLPYGASR